MKAFKYTEIKPVKVEGAEVKGDVYIRWLLNKESGANTFAMRYFEVHPGAQAGPHSHPWEHEVFVLEGTGIFMDGDDREYPVEKGSVVYIEPDEPHQLRNTGDSIIKYLCLVPAGHE